MRRGCANFMFLLGEWVYCSGGIEREEELWKGVVEKGYCVCMVFSAKVPSLQQSC